jgi:hypothetical protein
MLFFQDEKDKLRDTLSQMQRQINYIETNFGFRIDMLGKRVDSMTHPHGAQKDGTPRAKPGRKPGVKA